MSNDRNLSIRAAKVLLTLAFLLLGVFAGTQVVGNALIRSPDCAGLTFDECVATMEGR